MDKTNTAHGLEKVANRGKACNLQKIPNFFPVLVCLVLFFIFVIKSQSGGPGFESRSGHLLKLFSVAPKHFP